MFRLGIYRIRQEETDWEGSIYRPLSFVYSHPKFKGSKNVSFCIWANQADLDILEKTLRKNLISNYQDRSSIEFVLLLCGDTDVVQSFALKFSEEIKDGYVVVHHLEDTVDDKTKNNLSFQLAQGKVLSSIAVDDYTGPRAGNYIFKMMTCQNWSQALWMKAKRKQSKRLSISRDLFFEMGGFDEKREPFRQVDQFVNRLYNYQVQVEIINHDLFLEKFERRREGWSFFLKKSNPLKCEMTNVKNFNIKRIT